MLNCDKFVEALKRGDGGETLRTAELGTILGFDTYMFQNVNHVLDRRGYRGWHRHGGPRGRQPGRPGDLASVVAGEFASSPATTSRPGLAVDRHAARSP